MESPRSHVGAIAILISSLILPLAACDLFGSQTPAQHIQDALAYRGKGELNAAIIELKNALQQSPDNAKARLLLGRIYVENGQGQAAEKELRRATSLGVAEVEVAADLARALLMQGRYQDVLDTLKPSQQPNAARRAEALITKGNAERALGKIELACADYQQASELDAQNLSAELGLASCDALQGRIEQARARVKSLLQQHPKHVQGWIMLGRIEADAKQSEAAIHAFSNALELSPKEPGALLGRARIELAENQLDAAQADIDVLHELARSSVQVNYLLGSLRLRQGRLDDAAVAYQDALRASPGFAPAILWLGLTHYAQRNYEQAIQGFSRFLQDYPNAVRVKVLLALSQSHVGGADAAVRTMRELQGLDIEDPKVLAAIGQAALSAGDSDMGRHYFEQAVAQAPEEAAFRTALARALLQSGDAKQAIEELATASELDQKDIRADVALIRMLIAKGQLDQAMPAIERLEDKRPDSDIPHALRGLVFALKQNNDKALKEFKAALEKDPNSIAGHHGLALLAVQRQDFAAANEHYQAVLDAHPGNLQSELALASLAAKSGERAQTLSWLEQAVKDNPESAIAAGLYARALLAQGEVNRAAQVTQEALNANPKHAGLLYIRAAALLAEGENQAAARTFQELVDAKPDFVPARIQLARARARQGDTAGARKALMQALEVSPRHLDAKVALLQVELREKHFNRAIDLAHEIEQVYPRNPIGRLLAAQVHLQQGDLGQAMATLRSAAKAHPKSRAVIRSLARLQWVAGEKETSVTTIGEWLQMHPDDLELARELGDRYLSMGRNQAAVDVYQKIIEARPRNAVVLNNLALAYWPDDPKQAVELARQANRLAPKSPAVQDTLGWMLVRTGRIKQGLLLLKSARELLQDSPSVHYHYAAALARAGEQSAARQELADLLAGDKSFPEKHDAQALLEEL
ncbi:MAG: PEP-CTERM system TPR-repeat protein PrsT [Nitrococcus sp.]|nr:PEP-CTERM system TPR-repeat protein PrsT [Nitrococcus sp.]